jgi:4-hydroxybenzoate polyprenyltransferase
MSDTAPQYTGPPVVSFSRYQILLETMRPWQWTKNAFIFAGVLFAGRALEVEADLRALATFVAFCAISSAAYLINDLRDRETDRLNPRTANRPIARGDIGARTAVAGAAGLTVLALAIAAALNWKTLAVLGGYGVMQGAYTTVLKHVLFLDVMTIAAGFLLRALAGLVCIDAVVSPWLLLATGLLALFLALGKRRSELLQAGTTKQRAVLAEYSIPLLDELISVVTPCIVLVYALYSVLAAPADAMLITLPFVIYGIFRVLYVIHHGGGKAEDPTVLAIRDRPLLVCIVLWAIVAGIITVLNN